jgi:putative CocE/NonD family hydrolase
MGTGSILGAPVHLAAAEPRDEPGRSPATYNVKMQFNVRFPMRDGVKLSADIYRPDAPGKFPALLLRTYHDNATPAFPRQAVLFAKRGYAVVAQDVRGRYDSDGEYTPYVNEPRDGYDTQQWLGQQAWCNGTIGTFGKSLDGFC